MRVAIVTPIYSPHVGGAAIHYESIVSVLISRKYEVTIFTSRCRDRVKDKNVDIKQILPDRMVVKKYMLFNYLLYVLQNLIYVYLTTLLLRGKYDRIIIHSSFFNNLNILEMILKLNLFKSKSALVLDVRDNEYHQNIFSLAKYFDDIICCSLQASKAFNKAQLANHYIPPSVKPRENNKSMIVSQIVTCGIIKEEKGYNRLLNLAQKLTDQFTFELFGPIKDTGLANKLGSLKNVYVRGEVPHDMLLCEISRTNIFLSLSQSEGVPRSCLEALCMGVRCVLPNNISEFVTNFPDYCCNIHDINDCIDNIQNGYKNEAYHILARQLFAGDSNYENYADIIASDQRKR
jgi:glycosyltransferase involved in cell wall biosynthesis